jgi:phosphate transport system permease protein
MTDTLQTPAAAPAFTPKKRVRFDSPEAIALVRKRYGVERRFKAYGIAAIAFAAIFIVILVSDILIKAYPAFTEHRLNVPLTVSAERVAAGGKTDRETLMQGDWAAVVREGVSQYFPEVTARSQRNKLYNELISIGGADDLRAKVVADPSLIGKKMTAPVLLSDDADLYFKGHMTAKKDRIARAPMTVSDTKGDVTVTAGAGEFAEELRIIRANLANDALRAQREVTRLNAALGPLTGDKRTALQDQVNRQSAVAADLDQRAKAQGGSAIIDTKVSSILIKVNGGIVRLTEVGNDSAKGTVLTPLKQAGADPSARVMTLMAPEDSRKLSDQQIAWLEKLQDEKVVSSHFNSRFLFSGDSREAELAGILGGLVGSALTMLVTLGLCLPIGVGAAIYLEEFAPKNRITDLIEVNINNLAAVPSIVFGLLGLAIFLNTFGLPRSSPLVGGLVLALLVLPTIIISARAALRAVPPSIREAALGIGASHQQAVFQHVLPLAMPGILTGTIIGMAHALGETAPLLMIGMIAFILEVPQAISQSATVLPVQIFLWSDLPELAFRTKTAAAIVVLLIFLFVMNGAAIMLRKRFERRW